LGQRLRHTGVYGAVRLCRGELAHALVHILGSPIAAARALAGMAWYPEYLSAQASPPPRRRAKEDPR